VRALLKQPQLSPLSAAEQVMVLYAVTQGVFDELTDEKLAVAEAAVIAALPEIAATARRITDGKPLDRTDLDRLLATARNAVGPLLVTEKTADND